MKVLLLSPHTDDIEMAAGATVAKLVREGNEIMWAVFSICSDAVPKGCAKDELKKEFEKSSAVCGIKNCKVFDFPNKRFHEKRQEILDEMVRINREFGPDLVIGPSLDDMHQDHQTISSEMFRCFKKSSGIIGYEMPWNNLNFSPRLFVEVSEEDMKTKMKSLECYKTQFTIGRDYFSKDFIYGIASARGVQAGCKYAEAFEVLRWRL
jgi:N-acetylglucosamine malate deacetylase 1